MLIVALLAYLVGRPNLAVDCPFSCCVIVVADNAASGLWVQAGF